MREAASSWSLSQAVRKRASPTSGISFRLNFMSDRSLVAFVGVDSSVNATDRYGLHSAAVCLVHSSHDNPHQLDYKRTLFRCYTTVQHYAQILSVFRAWLRI